ncbi:MAG: metal-dependent hydrolase, partial [Armatimonadetes bacterium]|nr:metal-dependent hydrolase [Armatimonadota bacterium]
AMIELPPLFAFLVACAAVCVVGDALTIRSWRERSWGWGVFDGLQHGLVGLAVALPVLLEMGHLWPWCIVFVSATAVDVDHFVRFPDWWPISEQDREHRRALHSLVVAVVAGLIAGLLAGEYVFAWLAAVGVISHLCRDTQTGTVPLFFPVRCPMKWRRHVYIASELLLTGASSAVSMTVVTASV